MCVWGMCVWGGWGGRRIGGGGGGWRWGAVGAGRKNHSLLDLFRSRVLNKNFKQIPQSCLILENRQHFKLQTTYQDIIKCHVCALNTTNIKAKVTDEKWEFFCAIDLIVIVISFKKILHEFWFNILNLYWRVNLIICWTCGKSGKWCFQLIDIRSMPIHMFEESAFRGLASLQTLRIEGCQIPKMPPINPVKRTLIELMLSHNILTSIPEEYFYGFTELWTLDLPCNAFTANTQLHLLSFTLYNLYLDSNIIK